MITSLQNTPSYKANKTQRQNSPAFGMNLGKGAEPIWEKIKTGNFFSEKSIQNFQSLIDDPATKHLTVDTLTTKNGDIHLVMTTEKEDAFRKSVVLHTAEPQKISSIPIPFAHNEATEPYIFLFPVDTGAKTANGMFNFKLKSAEEIARDMEMEIQNKLIELNKKKVVRINKNILQDSESVKNMHKVRAALRYAKEKTPSNLTERTRLQILGNTISQILEKSFQTTGVTKKEADNIANLASDPSLKGISLIARRKNAGAPTCVEIYSKKNNNEKPIHTFQEPEKMTIGDYIKSIFHPEKYDAGAFLRSLTPKKIKAMEQTME